MTLPAIAAAVIYTVVLWWFSTGAILWLDRRPRRTHIWSLIGCGVVAVAAGVGLWSSMRDASPSGAFVAFTCALGLWGWHELSFLTGFISGPRTAPCPPEASGWRRFVLASATLIYHEIALVLTAGVLLWVTWAQPNRIGAWTFLILLVSRLSAKLNLFFGVPNFTAEFFPDHLRYLTSYLRKSPVNAMFPVSLLAGGVLALSEARVALRPDATPFQVAGFSLIFALTALAVIEHAFMALPLHDAALWRWALPNAAKNGATELAIPE